MIALNELLSNIEEFSNKYKYKGVRFNPKFFVDMEKKRKALQLETEKMRADCNKLCADSISNKINKNAKINMQEIDLLNNKISKNNKILDRYNTLINKKLAKLHNLPDELSNINAQLQTKRKAISKDIVRKFVVSLGATEKIKLSHKEFYKSMQGRVFDESELPKVFIFKDSAIIYCKKQDAEKYENELINFFKENALATIKLRTKQLRKECSSEYFIHLNKSEWMRVRCTKEFHTRAFSVKYRDKSVDMTKFVNQINVILK